MKSHYLNSKTGRILLALSFLVGVGMVSTASAQNWPSNQDPYRQNRRDDRYGRNGGYNNNMYQVAAQQGYQDGMYTGENDAARRQNYNPQRSHYYRNGHGDNGNYGNNGRSSYQFQQAYRQGFMQGYNEGYQRYGGNNRRNNGRYNRLPFPF